MIDTRPIQHLLWDVDKKTFRAEEYPEFLADRIGEKGRIEDLNWYFKNFSFAKFKDRISMSPNVTKKTKKFWEIFVEYNQVNQSPDERLL